jgi:hypothetical protein
MTLDFLYGHSILHVEAFEGELSVTIPTKISFSSGKHKGGVVAWLNCSQ